MSNKRSESLISLVKKGIRKANALDSPHIKDEGFLIHGRTGVKVRILLNTLLTLEDAKFLEVGSASGATFCSAMYQNKHAYGVTIDNFSEFERGKNKIEIVANFKKHFSEYNIQVLDIDFTTLSSESFKSPFNIYFYDGPHALIYQTTALPHFVNAMEDTFIYVCDDISAPDSAPYLGTKKGIEIAKLKVLYEHIEWNPDCPKYEKTGWANGVYVAVLQKTF